MQLTMSFGFHSGMIYLICNKDASNGLIGGSVECPECKTVIYLALLEYGQEELRKLVPSLIQVAVRMQITSNTSAVVTVPVCKGLLRNLAWFSRGCLGGRKKQSPPPTC